MIQKDTTPGKKRKSWNDYEKKRGTIHLEIDQLNRITVIKQIYTALDPSHKNLMENVKRILDSDQPEEVRFRIFMVMYRHTRISLGKVSKMHYGEFLTAGTTESMWQEAKLLYRGLMARKEKTGWSKRRKLNRLDPSSGDVVVTLIILAMQNDMDLYECLNCAYDEIKGCTGKMVNGVFVKSSDL